MPNTHKNNNLPTFVPFLWAAISFFISAILGSLANELEIEVFISIHIILVSLSSILLISGFRKNYAYLKRHRFPLFLILFDLVFLGLQLYLGQRLYNTQFPFWIIGFHYSSAVLILGGLVGVVTYITLFKGKSYPLKRNNSFSKHTITSVVLGLFVLFSGVFVSIYGNRETCITWPLCEGGIFPQNSNDWIIFSHRVFVAIIGIYLLWFNKQAWQKNRSRRLLLSASNLFVVLYFAQGFVGAIKTLQNFPVHLVILHEASAILFVVVGFILVTASIGVNDAASETAKALTMSTADRKQRFRDLLALNKPVVVLLLLSTTFAGMIIGAGKIPSFNVLFVTMVGGFLAAGGSSAINQYIDRDLDGIMRRTSNRPIPSGRLTPAEGLAFGLSALVISFYLLAGFVNILAALLALAGMIYYVLVYSIFLKKRSVQNIVIGGGAGAIPPLVGWAAATGTLTVAALFLFLFVFLWTPPHFWALALLRKNEYAAAGVPMMPVEKGDHVTKKLIFQYSAVLVLSTIVMWVLGLAGWIFLGGAVILGIYLLSLSKQVMVKGRNKIYYKMYRHSNYYLLMLFAFLAIDSIIL